MALDLTTTATGEKDSHFVRQTARNTRSVPNGTFHGIIILQAACVRAASRKPFGLAGRDPQD